MQFMMKHYDFGEINRILKVLVGMLNLLERLNMAKIPIFTESDAEYAYK